MRFDFGMRNSASRTLALRTQLLPGVCSLFLLLAGCEDHKQAAAPPAKPTVSVQLVALKGVNQSFEFVGHIMAVNKVLFREGQDVKAGDLLYQIEKIQYQAQVDQTKANMASAEAKVTNAQFQYNRKLQLSKDSWAPQSDVDQYKANLDSDKATVLQARAALTRAEVNLGYTDVWSPIDGLIGRTVYTLGNLVNPASGVLVTIVSQDPMYVLFPISVRDLETIREARRNEEGGLAKIDIRLRLPNGQEYAHRGVWNLT